MMKRVLYLCLNNELNNVGLVFPHELEEHFYAPGFFIIETIGMYHPSQKGKFYDEYLFLGVEEGKIVKHILQFQEKNKFVVKTRKHGDIDFEAIYVPTPINRYIGTMNEFYDHEYSDFYVLKCADIERLENLCKKYDFYFVGFAYDKNNTSDI